MIKRLKKIIESRLGSRLAYSVGTIVGSLIIFDMYWSEYKTAGYLFVESIEGNYIKGYIDGKEDEIFWTADPSDFSPRHENPVIVRGFTNPIIKREVEKIEY